MKVQRNRKIIYKTEYLPKRYHDFFACHQHSLIGYEVMLTFPQQTKHKHKVN